ncbi:MAG: FAD-linked oxidase C-terminal domain-containing protein [Anaerolineae bacterium]|nr:FAD-linked oxidase C-terminal domain-containing protein [Anaerolineae bacterium]
MFPPTPTEQDAAVTAFLQALSPRVRGDLRHDRISRQLYSTDASIYQVMPHGVLIPREEEDVHAAVELAAAHQVPLLPRAAGSSLAGQAVNKAVVIDFTRHLNQILEVNAEEGWIWVQPGIVLDEMNAYLRQYGLQFGPDPASSNRAAMGGIVSNNSTGSHSILYGMTADHVLEMRVLLSDGSYTHFGPLEPSQLAQRMELNGLEGAIYRQIQALVSDRANQETIRRGTPRHWRRCGGYNLDRFVEGGVTFQWPRDPRFNLAHLVSGAEGGLAVITALKLNLVPLPERTALAIIHYDSLYEALSSVPTILEVEPSAVELLDNLGLTMCRDVPEYARLLQTFVVGQPNCVLITEFYGESEAELRDKVERLEKHLRRQQVSATTVVPALDARLQANVWTVRKVGLGLMMSIKGDHKPIPFIEDAAVPVEHLAAYVTRIERFCNDLGTNVAYYAHASAGCIHIRPLINTKKAEEVAKLPQITQFSAELLGQYGGSLSSEHGDGRARTWMNKQFFGKPLYDLYCQVKDIFDPQRLLNPGTVVEGGPMTENLRYGTSYSVLPLKEHLDFHEDMGFHRAIEMCNGAGICRKRTTGTMCPSFMVTREEEHSTRGRANILRAAISGQPPNLTLTSQEVYDALDLCISCKGCKSECPSSVDMAKIKTEFLAHYYDEHGKPLRARLFGDIARLSRLASGRLAPVANGVMGYAAVRAALQSLLGISGKRSLPPFAAEPFTTWYQRHHAERSSQHALRRVVLFNDTFNTYNDPHIAIAATEFLQVAGFDVVLPGHRCCGRPQLSKGLVGEAREAARDTVERLAPFAAAGIPIVGLEPSCLLTLRDEYFSLLPGDGRVAEIAALAYTFEEFVADLASNGELDVVFSDEPRQLLLHGHCHQKALVGTGPTHQALTLPRNYQVEEVDSGCCGMAGSFGYEAEHYEISQQIGERALFPAVRASGGDTVIVAPGTSCRHQIAHGTGRQAVHPAEVLRAALAS